MSSSEPPLFERLAKVEPAKLARLLAELASQDPTVLEQVQFLLAAGNATATAKTLRSTLRAWTRSQRFIPTKTPLPSVTGSRVGWTAWSKTS